MRRRFLFALAVVAAPALHAQQADGPYKVLRSARVGGEGGTDYINADPVGRRLYITRNAVREVEEALVNLASVDERQADIEKSARGLKANFEAARVRLGAGLGSALEFEEARRASLAADLNVASQALERLAAWVALYRAVGGGWEGEAPQSVSNLEKK